MKHRFKSINGAVRRIRQLEKIVAKQGELLERYNRDRHLLAKLASRTPAFDNPIFVMEAEKLRDSLL